MQTRFTLLEDGVRDSGVCDCCGHTTRTARGFADRDGLPFAAYAIRWTSGHIPEHGAIVDLLFGRWGNSAGEEDPYIVTLDYRVMEAGGPAFMVIDAETPRGIFSRDAGRAMRRDEVIGTSIAHDTFALVDVIFADDGQIGELRGEEPSRDSCG